jgi:hypothetical protein
MADYSFESQREDTNPAEVTHDGVLFFSDPELSFGVDCPSSLFDEAARIF